MQRALLLNIATIKKNPANIEFQKLFADPRGSETARRLERAVRNELPPQFRDRLAEHDIRFDFPRSPKLSEDAEQCNVLVSPGVAQTLKTFFPTEDWVASYADNKLTSHVFAVGNLEFRTEVADAAERVLQGLYHLELDPASRRALK